MKGDVFLLSQLINSMEDAVNKLEVTKSLNNLAEFNKIKEFILDLQKRIDTEANNL